jgi:hypothetical protein
MSALFKKPGFSGIMKNTQGSSSIFSTMGYIVLYILVAAIVGFVVVMLLGIKIDLNWFDFRSPYTKVMSRSSWFWKPSTQFANLMTFPNAIPGFQNSSYSTIIDCVLYNSRSYNTIWSGGDGPYRHIYHRGSNELQSSTVKNMLIGGCGAMGNLSELPPYGLPRSMNPGVFLDPNLNDILVFVDTENATRESVRIVDIPLDIPFRIAIIVNHNVLEVYINCKLEVTKIMKNMPRSVENQWYGLAGPASAQAQIMNMHVWKYPLTAGDIRPLCPGLPDFTVKRPICDNADMPVSKEKEPTTTEPAIDLGFNKILSKCGGK